MGVGQYKRTEEIRKKQSESAKLNYEQGLIDIDGVREKRAATIERRRLRGERVGRPPASEGGVYSKSGEHKPCPVCSSPVYYTKGDISKSKRKCCSKACLAQDPVFRAKMKSVDKSYMQTEEYKSKKRKDSTLEFTRYKNAVHRCSQRTYEENFDILNPNGYPRTVCGVEGGWQLDHIKTIRECFDQGVSVEEASRVSNLRLLPWKDNLMRNFNSVDLQENNMA